MATEADFIPYQAVTQLCGGPALVFAPHPDDEVFGCGGAILRHVAAGEPVRVVVLTDGELYGHGRRAEAECAARVLGYGVPEFWGHADRGLRYGEPLVRRMQQTIVECGAAVVYAPSIHEVHPDHRAAGMAALEAVRRLGGERLLAMYEIGVPQPANRLLDITDLLARKLEAVDCFESQLARHRYADFISGLNRYRAYTLPMEVEAAEGYRLVAAEAITGDLVELYRSIAHRNSGPSADPDRPLVSVVVRAAGSSLLAETLDTIALQTYPRIEVVAVEVSGIGEALGAVCGPFELRVVTGGAGKAQAANLGIGAAEGDLVLVIDEGDRLDPDHVAGLVACLESAPAAVAACSGFRIPGGERSGAAFDPLRLWWENTLALPAVLFRRSATPACSFDPGLGRHSEWDFWLQLCRIGPLVQLDAVSCSRAAEEATPVSGAALHAKWLPAIHPDVVEEMGRAWHERESALGAAHESDERHRLELAALREKCVALEQRASAYDARVAELEAERSRLEAACADACRQSQALLGSTSWRLTAPIRRIIDLIRQR